MRTKRAAGGSRAVEENEQELRSELADLCQRVDESLNRLDSQSQARIARLEKLLRAADDRISRLEYLNQQTPEPPARADDRGLQQPATLPATDSVADVSATTTAPLEPEPEACSSGRRRIYEMADKGLPAIKIAEAVAAPLGEVELVLNLRRFAAG
jgi:hypothetical protein